MLTSSYPVGGVSLISYEIPATMTGSATIRAMPMVSAFQALKGIDRREGARARELAGLVNEVSFRAGALDAGMRDICD